MEVVASLSQCRTAAAQCGLFTYKSVPVIFEPPCTQTQVYKQLIHTGCRGPDMVHKRVAVNSVSNYASRRSGGRKLIDLPYATPTSHKICSPTSHIARKQTNAKLPVPKSIP